MQPGALQRNYLQDPVLLHLDFTWTSKTFAFPEFPHDPGNMVHAFLDYYVEADGSVVLVLHR